MIVRDNSADDVFVIAAEGGTVCFHRSENPFSNPLSEAEKSAIIEFHRSRGRALEDGDGIRLNDVRVEGSRIILDVSTVPFFDFLTTNLLIPGELEQTGRDIQCVDGWRSHRDWRSVLGDTSLSNMLAISALVTDAYGRTAIMNRSDQVVVNPRAYGASITGTPDLDDYNSDNPLESCLLREASEELGLTDLLDVQFRGMVVGSQKMQPVALFTASIGGSWGNHGYHLRMAEDFLFENRVLMALSPLDLARSLESPRYTVVARHQVEQYLRNRSPNG